MESLTLQPSNFNLGWFHRYPARFPVEAICLSFNNVINHIPKKEALILDPFSGTGTTLSIARQLGIKSIGIELSKLGIQISRIRTLNPEYLNAAVEIIEEMVSKPTGRSYASLHPDLIGWIGKQNGRSVSSYKRFIGNLDNSFMTSCIELAISSALRPASRWLTGSIRPQKDPDRVPPDIGPKVLQAARILQRDNLAEHCDGPTPLILKGDARVIPLPSASIDAVVTSPPYGTTYDYFDVQRLSYLALDWPWERSLQVGRSSRIPLDGTEFTPPDPMKHWYYEVYRGETTVQGRALRAYFTDMRIHFQEVKRVLKPGGIVAYSLANSKKKGRTFNLIGSIIEVLCDFGFKDAFTIKRTNENRRILPAGRDPSNGRFSSSHSGFPVDEQIIYAFK